MRSYFLENITLDDVKNIARTFSEEKGTAFLHSGKDIDGSTESKSFLFLFPVESFEINREDYLEKDPHDLLEKKLSLSYAVDEYPAWVGYIGYEFAGNEKYCKVNDNFCLPELFFQKNAVILKYYHNQSKIKVFCDEEKFNLIAKEQQEHLNIFKSPENLQKFFSKISIIKWDEIKKTELTIEKPFEDRKNYLSKIEIIKKLIREGRVYEVNLSHELVLRGKADPFSIFLNLSKENPAPFSAFLNFPFATIVSSSPERFLLKKKEKIESRPIKGTVARGKTLKEDKKNEKILKTSEKEKAELRMITDLMRNDLYHISKKGSIEVKKTFHIEKYTNVFQQLSIIEAKARKDALFKDIIKAAFPGGSITGCPKKASQDVISLLEKRNRGIYTGSIGYITKSGDFDFNIAIRTLVLKKMKSDKSYMISLSVGGAVTLLSDPFSEYRETLLKAESLFKSLGVDISEFSLF